MIRSRLILANTIAVAIVLVLLGVVLFYVASINRMSTIDQELARRGQAFASRWPPPDFNRGPRGEGGGVVAGRDGRDGGRDGGGGRPPDFDREQAERQGIDPALARRFELERSLQMPRVFRPDGTDVMFRNQLAWLQPDLLKAMSDGEAFSTIQVEGETIRVYSLALREKGRVTAISQMAMSLRSAKEDQASLLRVLLLMLPVGLLATFGAGMFLARRALLPVGEMADSMARIEASDLSQRLPVAGNDEFADLSTRFNGLLERLEHAFQRQRQLVADASHELKTPLTVIRARTDLAMRGERTPEQYKEHLAAISRASHSMTRIVGDLLLLAEADENRLHVDSSEVNVQELVKEAVASLPEESQGRIAVDIDPTVTIRADFSLLTRLFRNLLENSDRHTPPEGSVAVTMFEESNRIHLRFLDTGSGISSENLKRIFDRFYRVDEARDRRQGGTGLGLAICKAIVEAHNGEISIESEEGQGTTVHIFLPRDFVS